MQAYYANDDERARENWQRLDPERPAARIAAPFRAAIDRAYQQAQSPPVQAKLQQQFDSTQPSDLRVQLKALGKALDRPDSLSEALTLAERLLPTLRQQAPQIVSRLATICYWKVLQTGPNDLNRYRRVFGGLPTDPKFERLNALGNELGGNLDKAHRHWEAYQKEIAAMPAVWPGEEGPLARALVWVKMAENAASIPTAAQFAKMPRAIRHAEAPPKPLHPTAEECYRKAIELAPALSDAHTGLFRSMLLGGKEKQAIEAGEALIEKFPHDVETARMLGAVLLERERHQRACEVWEQVVRMQPLDTSARQFLAGACRGRARELVLKKDYAQARLRYQAALDYSAVDQRASTLCCWAVAERIAGDPARADELLAQARAVVGELYISYLLLVEAHRMSLAPKEKTLLGKEFTTKLADPVDTPTVLALVEYAASLVMRGVTYYGIKTHIKKIIALASKLDIKTLDEGGASEYEYEDEKVRVKVVMARGQAPVVTGMTAAAAALSGPATSPAVAAIAADPNVVFVTSPFVGTFYRAPSPESEDFVSVNGSVKKGQTLCIIEAMKLMNEIEAEFSGTVLEVLVDSGKSVEFGQKLFKIRKS